jgi:hypothetical protein
LNSIQKKDLISLLKYYNSIFAWDYQDMRGINPNIYKHNIYIHDDSQPFQQPQQKLNPTLKEIEK